MYQQSKALTEPGNSRQLLWRYIAEDRLIDLLETEELFFTHIPKFADGLEGSLTARSREHLVRWFMGQGSSEETAIKEVETYESHANHFYANCWHMNNHESYLMWKAYADRGYAIRSTFERAKASFSPFEGAVTAGVIQYVDFERALTKLGNVFTHVSTKDLPYKDERELRFFFWEGETKNKDIMPCGDGVRVKINVPMLIERVFVSPRTKRPSDRLRELFKARGIECNSSYISHRGE